MPADRAATSKVTYNASADPRRRPAGSTASPAPTNGSDAAVASTSALPIPPPPPAQPKPTPYDRPLKPGLIRCEGACGKDLPKERFSEQQHKNRRRSVGKAMMCEDCAPPQQLSMKCAECATVKPSTSFALRQRKNPTSAVCSACQSRIDARNRQKRDPNAAYGSDVEDSSDSEAEEERAKVISAKGNPYEQADDEDDWDLYR